MLNNGADIPLEELNEDLKATLTQQTGKMRVVDQDELVLAISGAKVAGMKPEPITS